MRELIRVVVVAEGFNQRSLSRCGGLIVMQLSPEDWLKTLDLFAESVSR
jgi:hypothetical protein